MPPNFFVYLGRAVQLNDETGPGPISGSAAPTLRSDLEFLPVLVFRLPGEFHLLVPYCFMITSFKIDYAMTGKSGMVLQEIRFDFSKYLDKNGLQGNQETWLTWWKEHKQDYAFAHHSDY